MRKEVKRSELIKHRTYTTSKSDKLLLELVYRIWYADGSIERFHIPKIELPLGMYHVPDICNESLPYSKKSYIPTKEDLPILPIGDMVYTVEGVTGEVIDAVDSTLYVSVREKEADPVEMTIEQIEKELRKKIKIVGKGVDNCNVTK